MEQFFVYRKFSNKKEPGVNYVLHATNDIDMNGRYVALPVSTRIDCRNIEKV